MVGGSWSGRLVGRTFGVTQPSIADDAAHDGQHADDVYGLSQTNP